MKKVLPTLSITTIVFASIVSILPISHAFEFSWEIDETPEGQESATAVEPILVKILDEHVEIPPHSASLQLMKKYSVHLTPEWSRGQAYRLLETFESIPQLANHLGDAEPSIPASMWTLRQPTHPRRHQHRTSWRSPTCHHFRRCIRACNTPISRD